MPNGVDGRRVMVDERRALVAHLVRGAVLLGVGVPLAVLHWDVPFLGAAAMILAAATLVYSVERWEEPDRARKLWCGWLPVVYLVNVAVLLGVFVPLLVLEWDVPFLGAVAMILAGTAVVYSVERWEDPVRARKRWLNPWEIGAAVLVALTGVVAVFLIILLA